MVQGDREEREPGCSRPLKRLPRPALCLDRLVLGEQQVAELIAPLRIEQRAAGLALPLQTLGFPEQLLGHLPTTRLVLGIALFRSLL